MFAQAGMRDDCHVICAAIVRRPGRTWRRPAFLVTWPGTGDYAWLGDRGISWSEQVRVVNHPEVYSSTGEYHRPREALPA